MKYDTEVDTQTNQWDRIERVEKDSCLYEQLIYEKASPMQQQRNDIFRINLTLSFGYTHIF